MKIYVAYMSNDLLYVTIPNQPQALVIYKCRSYSWSHKSKEQIETQYQLLPYPNRDVIEPLVLEALLTL